MRLLEDEQKQRTAMELLEQYMQFKQEAEKDGKKNKKEKDPLKPKHPMSVISCSLMIGEQLLLPRTRISWR
ncbi:hypothetical protein JHK87_012648 [Glycine soja]|nr:hypothetical protein JHK87_012648 [Glycine soja]